jgi:hypothetical protein
MMQKSKYSIKLKSHVGFQFWKTKMMMACENVRENVKDSATDSLGYYDLKQHKPWFDNECSLLLYEGKQAKFSWLQNQSLTNGDNLNIVRYETSRT